MKFKLFILLSLLFFFKMEAQNIKDEKKGFKLQVSIPTQKKNKLYLGQYQAGATYVRDSVLLSEEGIGRFEFKEHLPAGQYFLYTPSLLQVDLLIDKEQNDIRAYINEEDFSKNTISGCEDTKLLWEYLTTIQKQGDTRSALTEKLDDPKTPEQEKISIRKELATLYLNTESYIKKRISEHNDKWFGVFVKGIHSIIPPIQDPKTDKDFSENEEYEKIHYFDNISLTDPRMWRTNYLTSYIDIYMQQKIDPNPDSLAIAASKLVQKSQKNELCSSQMLLYLINQYFNNDIMGTENIWARLFEDHMLDKNITWLNSSQIGELKKKYETIKNNRIGMKAQNLRLETIDDSLINTNDIDAEFLILCFYSYDCHFCQDEIPKLHNELYTKYKDKGLQVIAMNISNDKQKWMEFVNTKETNSWINCYDPKYKSQYWMYFDTSTIPATYILDKNKTIVAKKLDMQNLERFFDFHILNKNGIN